MNSSRSLLSPRAIQTYTFLLVACGAGLLLSIPPITRVARLLEPHWNPPWQTFCRSSLTGLTIINSFTMNLTASCSLLNVPASYDGPIVR